jgi:hypothetical protein
LIIIKEVDCKVDACTPNDEEVDDKKNPQKLVY